LRIAGLVLLVALSVGGCEILFPTPSRDIQEIRIDRLDAVGPAA
jgi:hypothetical protein